MYYEMGAREFRREMTNVLDTVFASDRRVMITRNGRAVAGLVTATDLRALDKADASRMLHHELMMESRLREIRQLKDSLYEERKAAAET